MLEMCWEKPRKHCGVSLLCQWIFTGVGCVPAQTQLQVEAQGQNRI